MSSEGGVGPSTSSSPSKEKMAAVIEAVNLLAQGKRNLICGEVPTAVQQFQDACRCLAATYGEMAKECAEAYFQYGSALLDLARMEQGVLGNALEGVDVDEDEEAEEESGNKEQFEPVSKLDDEERNKLRTQVVEAMSEDEIKKQAASLKNEDKKEDLADRKSDEAVMEVEGTETNEMVEKKADEKEEAKDSDTGGTKKDKKKEDGANPESKLTEEPKSSDSIELNKTPSDVVMGDVNIEKREKNKIAGDGNGMEKKEEDEQDETVEAMDKNYKDTDPPESGVTEAEEKMGEKTEDTEEEEENEEDGEEEGEETVDSQEDAEKEESEENPDDIPNLQLAWEMLELSKIIYSKDPSKESQLKAAEACSKLGEVSLEGEQYEQAIADLQICLKLQKEHLEPFDRAIAETYYQLGLACQMDKQLNLAVDHFKSAMVCLEEKIERLKIVVKEKPPKEETVSEPSQFVEPAESAQKEIEEIQLIIPEITDKITDSEEEAKTMENLKEMAKGAMGAVFSAASDSTIETSVGSNSKSPVKSTEKKASDISHLIRKKRKPEEETEDLENKKQKSDGPSSDNSAQNGHLEAKKDELEALPVT